MYSYRFYKQTDEYPVDFTTDKVANNAATDLVVWRNITMIASWLGNVFCTTALCKGGGGGGGGGVCVCVCVCVCGGGGGGGGWGPSVTSNFAIWCFLCCQPEQSVEQVMRLPVIHKAMMLVWRQSNGEYICTTHIIGLFVVDNVISGYTVQEVIAIDIHVWCLYILF